MMRSLYSGVSGLRVHQTKMDVIGNNISNVNTVGFKGSTVTFSDILYQNTQSASGPNAQTGMTGQNARQIGLGATVASIKTQMSTRGGAQRTDGELDLMISDNSFFIVNGGAGNYFTKSGSFEIDKDGTLCTSDGSAVMGWQVDATDPNRIMSGQVSPLTIMSVANMQTPPEYTTNARIMGNIDPKDVELKSTLGKATSIQFYDSVGNLLTAKLRIKDATAAGAATVNTYSIQLEDITAQDGTSIFVTKDPGTGNYVPNTAITAEFGAGAVTTALTPADIDPKTGKLLSGALKTAQPQTFNFDAGTGELVGVGAAGATTVAPLVFKINGAAAGLYPAAGISVDCSEIDQYATTGMQCSVEGRMGSSDNNAGAGKPVGKLNRYNVDQSGKIYGNYDNGDQKLLGQIAVATFANPAGLEAVGNNRFAATQNSGDFDGIGKDISAGGGKMTAGVLEMSNVDLSQQFTDMITTQRGFQANSRIITTSDTFLEELINLKR